MEVETKPKTVSLVTGAFVNVMTLCLHFYPPVYLRPSYWDFGRRNVVYIHRTQVGQRARDAPRTIGKKRSVERKDVSKIRELRRSRLIWCYWKRIQRCITMKKSSFVQRRSLVDLVTGRGEVAATWEQ